MYCAYVTRIHNLRKHTNADRLLCGECFGNTVIVDLGTDPDQLGVYFPTDGKLGLEFAQKNDLLRRKDENGAPAGGYLDPEKRNIKALKLRGEKSDGLFLPLSCLASFTDIKKLQEGDTISVLNGITICEKYVPAVKRSFGSGGGGNRVRKRSDPISPLFQEHADTEQLAYNLSAFHAGDLVEVTLKMHGTSQRTGYLPVLQGYKYRNGMGKRLYESRKTPNVIRSKIKRVPIYDWGYVTGTRRVVLDTFDEGGFYGNNAFREKHAKVFEGKLHKVPMMAEGWDEIRIVGDEDRHDQIDTLMLRLSKLEHDNPHHEYTVGQHSMTAWQYLISHYKGADAALLRATLLHDIGKEKTKVFHDIKGNPTEIAHFYHHERVGAYDSFCYTGDLSPNQRLTVALLIRWHMWPYAVEKSDNPSKTVSKIERLLGNDIWNQVMVLNTCDRNAH